MREISTEGGHAAFRSAANWLCLAAAPTFALMALLTAVLGDGPMGMICAGGRGASLLSGMATMYALMAAFHLAPWLRLIYPPTFLKPPIGASCGNDQPK